MAALRAAVSSCQVDFLVEFVDAAGNQQRGALSDLWPARFEIAAPVRSFPTYKGQRNFPGWWWSATVDRLIGFESWLERDHVMELDFDSDVVGLASQPLWLSWRQDGRWRRHAPDYFVRLADGSGVLVDVRPDERVRPRDAAAFAVTEQACRSVGWQYQRVGALPAVWCRNLRWLSRYRHHRYEGDPELRSALLEAFADGGRLRACAAEVADPLVSLPVVFHLMWCQVLTADLSGAVLTSATGVRAASGSS